MTKIEREPKIIKFPVTLIRQIEEYQVNNSISSFASAVYELCRIGLEFKTKNNKT